MSVAVARLRSLGLRPSPALEEAQRAIGEVAPRSRASAGPVVPGRLSKEERRLVSVLFAELSGLVSVGREAGPRRDEACCRQCPGER